MKNICYAGVLAALCDLDLEIIRALLAETYAKKPQLVDANMKAIQLGYDYARANFSCPLPLRVEKMDATAGHIIIDGNTAAALGCVYAGATVGAWYPITPSTSLMDAFKGFCDKLRDRRGHRPQELHHDPGRGRAGLDRHGDRRHLERRARLHRHLGPRHLADAGVPGAGLLRRGAERWCSTCSASDRPPACRRARSRAISLGRLCIAWRHAPGVPVSGQSRGVLRVCGQGVRSGGSAADAGAGAVGPRHRHERLDVPGVQMGSELSCPIAARCSTPEQIAKLDRFWRYYDHDNDGIPQRTLPGVNPKGAYFTRGSGHNQYGAYTEDSKEYQIVVDRLRKKWMTAARLVPKPVIERAAADRDRHRLARQRRRRGARGARCGCAPTASTPTTCACAPFRSARKWSTSCRRTRSTSWSSRTATRSCARLLIMETGIETQPLRSILHYNGMPIPASYVFDGVMSVVVPQRPTAQRVV